MIRSFFALAFFILHIFFSVKTYTQSLEPDFTWANNFGGTGTDGSFDIAADNQGSLIAAGSFENTINFGSYQLTATGTTTDIFLVKLDSSGNVTWAESAGGGDFDRAYCVTVDDQDNIIIAGNFSGRAFFDTSTVIASGNSDIFVAKYSPGGSLLWVVNYGTEGGYEYAYDITTDNNRNILVTGTSQNFGSVPQPCLILTVKFDEQGNLLWENAAGGPNFNNSGFGIAVNSLNEVFVTGCAADSVQFSPLAATFADPGGDIFIAKYSEAGVFNWVEQAGFNNNNDQGGAVTIDSNDDVFVTGHFRAPALFGGNITLQPAGNTDLFLAKFNTLGELSWVRQDSLPDDTYGTGISLDAAGNISVIGSYFISQQENNSIVVERFNKNGDILWNKLIAASPSYGYPGGIDNDTAGDMVLSGYYYNIQNLNEDIIIGKLPAPGLFPEAGLINFGSTGIGVIKPGSLTVSNLSAGNLFISGVMLAGPDANDFSLLNSLPPILLSQQSAELNMEFLPLTPGLKTAYLIIESDSPESPDTILLQGNGGTAVLSLSSDSLNFGSTDVSDSSELTLTLNNAGVSDITIDNYNITGSEYSLVNPILPDTIHPGENRILFIRFTPADQGLKQGLLIISGSSGSSPDTVRLYGTGRLPSLTYSADNLNFGNVDVNNSSDLTLTISNDDSFSRILNRAGISGINMDEFNLINSPVFPVTIQPGGFLNLNIRFTPSAPGLKSAFLEIISDSTGLAGANGNTDSITLSGNGIESVIVNIPESPVAGQPAVINANSPGPAFTINQFFYRRTGDQAFVQGQLNLSGNGYEGVVPPEFSTMRGIQFYIVFNDPVEGVTITYPSADPLNNPASVQVNVPLLNYPLPLQSNKYHLVSVPLVLSEPALSSLLTDDFGEYDNRLWRLFNWDPSAGSYREYENINENLQPHNAFWLINRAGGSFDIENTLSVPSNNSYTITLQPGWNLIANPFAFPVAWNTIENSELVLQAPALWNPLTEEYEYDQAVLIPWTGYWVYDSLQQLINLNVPPEGIPVIPGKAAFNNFSSDAFVVQIKAAVELTGFHDNQNYIGMDANASDSHDKLDILEAPPVTDNLSLSLLSEGKKYARSIVSQSPEGASWEIKISSAHKNKNVILNLEEILPLPGNFKTWLLDINERVSLPLINNSTVTNTGNSKEKNLRLIIGTEEYAGKVSENISLVPGEFKLFRNFPNPFNPVTNIYFSLKENSAVTLEVFDILGRKVNTLISNEEMSKGLHSVSWNGTGLSGSFLSSGIYIYRIKAGNFTESRKMMLLK